MQITPVANWAIPAAIAPHYEGLLAAIGTPDFGVEVHKALLALTRGTRRIYLFEAASSAASELQYSFCEPGVRELFPLYSQVYLQIDPVREAYRAAPHDGHMVLQRIRPADISSASFRRRFFDEPGIVERISVVQRGSGGWRAMSIARHRSDGCFSDREVEVVLGLACLALPMLPLNRERAGNAGWPSVAQLEERFAELYRGLTQRECQVCARAARGKTVEATALDLGIAKTSVLTYRKRAYRRLGVTSPFELPALVGH